MRRLGASSVALGAGVLVGSLLTGSRPLAVVGIGFLVAGVSAHVWGAFARTPVSVSVASSPSPAAEGDDVSLALTLRREVRLPVSSAHVRLGVADIGPLTVRTRGRAFEGEVPLGRLSRGVYHVGDAVLVTSDPLGLETIEQPLSVAHAVVVHPRPVELRTLFSHVGRLGRGGGRLPLRPRTGLDFRTVREHERGESLRNVHWPTTARRGRLMVRELDDLPRDGVAVVLDCGGVPPRGSQEWSFDVAARVAASLLRAHLVDGTRCVLVTNGREPRVVSAFALDGAYIASLDALAAARPDAPNELVRLLADTRSPVARAGELVIVTARLSQLAVDGLLATAGRRPVSVAWIDAPSFEGRPTRAHPSVLRLAAAGIPVAVIRSGDDLRTTLEAPLLERRAHG